MSRIGKQPVILPEKVEAKREGDILKINGPKGELILELKPEIETEITDKQIRVKTKDSAFWGLFRSLINNAVTGVSKGFEKELEIQGVGYKAELKDNKLVLELGFSHKIEFKKPEGIEIKIEKNIIKISGIDKQLVGQTAADIRGFKPPEPYKGKGIRYVGEEVRRKAGKRAAENTAVGGA